MRVSQQPGPSRRFSIAVGVSALLHAGLFLVVSLAPEDTAVAPTSPPIEFTLLQQPEPDWVGPTGPVAEDPEPLAAAEQLEPPVAPTLRAALETPTPSVTAAPGSDALIVPGSAGPTVIDLPPDYLRRPGAGGAGEGMATTGLDLSVHPAPGAGAIGRPPATAGEALARVVQPYDDLRAPHVRRPPQLRPLPGGGFKYSHWRFDAEIKPDGTVVFDAPTMPMQFQGAGFSFDLNDLVLHAIGEDPVAGAKHCFLEDVAGVRDELRRKHEQRMQMQSIVRIGEELRCILDDATRGPAERRAALFDIWDGCREDEVGAVARRFIVGFIRQFLPAGSAGGYPPEELERLNARRESRQRFAPYPARKRAG